LPLWLHHKTSFFFFQFCGFILFVIYTFKTTFSINICHHNAKTHPPKKHGSRCLNTIQFQVSENFQNQNNLSFQFSFFLNFKELVIKARFFNLIILLFLRPLSKWQDQLYDYWVSLVKVRTSSLIFVRSADQGSIYDTLTHWFFQKERTPQTPVFCDNLIVWQESLHG
jgi:hypothetical protein